jgi:putative transposase
MRKGKKRRKVKDYGVSAEYLISDEEWVVMAQCLPGPKIKLKAGRPRMEDRQAMTAILYVTKTAIQWKALPRSLGASSTVHDRFQEWARAGVFALMWKKGLLSLQVMQKLDLEWQAADGSMVKSPLGGEKKREKSYRPRQIGLQTKPAH